jgi:hypothetical protein
MSRFPQPTLFLYLRKYGKNFQTEIITAAILTELQSRVIKARTLHLRGPGVVVKALRY